MLLLSPHSLSLCWCLDEKQPVSFLFLVKTFGNKKQNSPAQAQPSLETKPRQHRDVEGFCFPNTAVFASPLNARGWELLKKVSTPPHPSGKKSPLAPQRLLERNVILGKGLVNPAPLLTQRKGCGNSSCAGPGHIQSLQAPPAQP